MDGASLTARCREFLTKLLRVCNLLKVTYYKFCCLLKVAQLIAKTTLSTLIRDVCSTRSPSNTPFQVAEIQKLPQRNSGQLWLARLVIRLSAGQCVSNFFWTLLVLSLWLSFRRERVWSKNSSFGNHLSCQFIQHRHFNRNNFYWTNSAKFEFLISRLIKPFIILRSFTRFRIFTENFLALLVLETLTLGAPLTGSVIIRISIIYNS